MDVIKVTISQMCTEPVTQRVSGIVSLLTEDRLIVLHCDSPLGDPDSSRATLLQDALRQLARMPEFRRRRGPLRCRTPLALPDA